ncbi:MAG: FAD-dependent oxidoreductase [Patescibacteria group bacterium]
MFDTIIIGGGPAGLTAAIYASRRGLKVLVLTRDIGGQIAKTNDIENFPGFELVKGTELAQKLFAQAKKFGAEIVFDEVKKISQKDNQFILDTARKNYSSKTLILAFGKSPRELNVPGEQELKGRGVTYCATCDAPFFKDKQVAVIGGGNSALDAALLSAHYANAVYLIHRGNSFRGEEILIEKVLKEKKIETIFNDEVNMISGEKRVETIDLKSGRKLVVDGLIIEVGFIIDRTLIKDFVELDETGQVVVNGLQETSLAGVFAAGDITQTPFKQAIISAGEGAKAALSCFDYLQKMQGKKGIYADWH